MCSGMLIDPADPEHPAVTAAALHRPAHLVGQGLEGNVIIRLRQALQIAPLGPSSFIARRNAVIACS